jgi:UDP-2,3-diacylglucosamine pyrophosphatase LpxH
MADDRPIFVISDLHMGDGGARDSFAIGSRENQLNLFLDHVARQQGELVVLGDLFEFWQTSVSKAITRHESLLDRLASLGATYVLGNHDADLAAFIGTRVLAHPFFQSMTLPIERVIGGKRFKFMHGHATIRNGAGRCRSSPDWPRTGTARRS